MDGPDRQGIESSIVEMQADIGQWSKMKKKSSFHNLCNDGTCMLSDQCQHKIKVSWEIFLFSRMTRCEYDRKRKSQKNIRKTNVVLAS